MPTPETESKLRQRTVGRLDRSRDPAILNAALAALTVNGYEANNMDDIAARAGVGKAAIYRRWSSKAALITDVLVYWRPDLRTDDVADTGSLADDFEALTERAARSDRELITNDLVLRVALEATHDAQLAAAPDDLILLKGRRIVSTFWPAPQPAVKSPLTEIGRWSPMYSPQWACYEYLTDKVLMRISCDKSSTHSSSPRCPPRDP